MMTSKRLSDSPAKHFAIAFLIAIAIYTVFYQFIEHRRNRKGPWEVTFMNNVSGDPQLLINQPFLGITNVQLTFVGAVKPTVVGSTVIFDKPRQVPYEVPFGKCIFMDTTFLPGTATFQFFGHEIELLPRIIMIDHEEHPWVSKSVTVLTQAPGTLELSPARTK